eukprot:1525112-Rhodomonas_salina.1
MITWKKRQNKAAQLCYQECCVFLPFNIRATLTVNDMQNVHYPVLFQQLEFWEKLKAVQEKRAKQEEMEAQLARLKQEAVDAKNEVKKGDVELLNVKCRQYADSSDEYEKGKGKETEGDEEWDEKQPKKKTKGSCTTRKHETLFHCRSKHGSDILCKAADSTFEEAGGPCSGDCGCEPEVEIVGVSKKWRLPVWV